jgi:hypothetical protein
MAANQRLILKDQLWYALKRFLLNNSFRWFQVVSGGFRWFQVVSGGFRWFQVVSGGFRWFLQGIEDSTLFNAIVETRCGVSCCESENITVYLTSKFL